MAIYKSTIFSGILVSLIIIYLSIIPIMIHQYRKYNGLKVRKNLVMFSFIIYMITAWFMTILPLPSFEEVLNMKTITPNLIPFKFVGDFFRESGFVISNPNSWIKAIKSPSFYTVAFNVILTLPFGVYLRKYFKFSLWKTVLFGLILSMFYELTQYTGLFGIYPKAYRLADIDDLIVNTFGTFLGYLVTPVIGLLLPNLEKDNVDVKSVNVSILRRGLAFLADSVIVNIFWDFIVFGFGVLGVNIASSLSSVLFFSIYFIFMPFIYDGETFGMKILKIKIVEINNMLSLKNILKRNVIIIIIIKLIPLVVDYFSTLNQTPEVVVFTLVLMTLRILVYLYYVILFIRKKNITFYDRLSSTRTVIRN